MVVLNQEVTLKREKIPAWLENCTCNETSLDVLQFPLDAMKLRNSERFPFYFVPQLFYFELILLNSR